MRRGTNPDSAVPGWTHSIFEPSPSVETPGYSRSSLQDSEPAGASFLHAFLFLHQRDDFVKLVAHAPSLVP